MVSREQKRASALHEKLQLLRSVTHSSAVNKTSIIVDASKYIEELKDKVKLLNGDIAMASNSLSSTGRSASLPTVTLETLEKGFLINVLSQKSCPGLLMSILEAFEELGLQVLEARVSCSDSFRLQVVGGENEEGESMGSQAVKQAVVEAIQKWNATSYNDEDDD